ncbi:hypothetical protein QBC43DRAFT_212925, partial [Cladorrhinum sp. PSN259]
MEEYTTNRLKELQKVCPVIGIIVRYVKKHYRDQKPPPWLDLRVVAKQLMRSPQSQDLQHRTYRSLRDNLGLIRDWMSNCQTWKDAAEISKMPYLGNRSEILASLIAVDATSQNRPAKIPELMENVQLQFLLDDELPPSEAMPRFWRGA